MNNSNFNNSSSRHHQQETDRRSYDKYTNKTYRTSHGNKHNGTNGKVSEIYDPERQKMLQDNLSDKILKTIIDFKSDRA